jgi:hypothetical protein
MYSFFNHNSKPMEIERLQRTNNFMNNTDWFFPPKSNFYTTNVLGLSEEQSRKAYHFILRRYNLTPQQYKIEEFAQGQIPYLSLEKLLGLHFRHK